MTPAISIPSVDLYQGSWQQVLTGLDDSPIEVDTLIADPPFGKRTHDQEEGDRYDGYDVEGMRPNYEHWAPADVHEFVRAWSPAVRGWMVCLTSHDLIPAYEAAYEAAGRYVFPPVTCLIKGMTVRRNADGPSSWTVYAMVGRPRTREFSTWGTLAGGYVGPRVAGGKSGRGKPLWLMRGLVNDYSRPGALICDPLAGWCHTLIAARALGRRGVGSERDAEAFAEGRARIARATQTPLLLGDSVEQSMELDGAGKLWVQAELDIGGPR